VINFVDVES